MSSGIQYRHTIASELVFLSKSERKTCRSPPTRLELRIHAYLHFVHLLDTKDAINRTGTILPPCRGV